jgi:hypothetical protein
MEKSFNIDGLITVDENWNEEQFLNEFLQFLDLKGWVFGGNVSEYTEEQDNEIWEDILPKMDKDLYLQRLKDNINKVR